MIDPVGLTLGLAGLFSTSVEVLDRISTAKSYGTDYHLFATKLVLERRRFFRWGQAVDLTGTQQHELLQDPEIQEEVRELLAWAIYFFEDSKVAITRHGAANSLLLEQGSSSSTARFEYPRKRARIHQKSSSAMMKVRWAFSGKRKSEKLLQEVIWFVDKLHELVPIAGTHWPEIRDAVMAPTIHRAVMPSGLSEPIIHRGMTPPELTLTSGIQRPGISELAPTSRLYSGAPEPLLQPPITMRLTGRRDRNAHRSLESSFRRKKKVHVRRIAAAAAHEIRVNER
jgi:hypothetical protein